MKVTAFFTVAMVLGYHAAGTCPQEKELQSEVSRCVTEMTQFVKYQGDKKEKCPNLKEGIDCIDTLLENCKSSPGFEGNYEYIQVRLNQSREDFDRACGLFFHYVKGSGCEGVSYSLLAMTYSYIVYLYTSH